MPDPKSPVIVGLEKFEKTIAKNQPPYKPLIALVAQDGRVLTRWEPSTLERQQLAEGSSFFLELHTHGHALQPVRVFIGTENANPEHFARDLDLVSDPDVLAGIKAAWTPRPMKHAPSDYVPPSHEVNLRGLGKGSITVLPDKLLPGAWRAEDYSSDGEVLITVFMGQKAELRAKTFAAIGNLQPKILDLLQEVFVERIAQDDEHGGPASDDRITPSLWRMKLEKHLHKVFAGGGAWNYRKQLIRVAALAIAAVQSWDRRNASEATVAPLAGTTSHLGATEDS